MNTKDNILKNAYEFLSTINQFAYKDIFLLSNQILSKNPFTNEFIKNYSINKATKSIGIFYIFYKLFRYYFFSLKDFLVYFLEFVQFYLASNYFELNYKNNQLVILDTFFVIQKVIQPGSFVDTYFPGLAEILKNSNKPYVYLPTFDGMKKRLTIYKVFKNFKKKNVPILSEYQLINVRDFLIILHFILIYPFKIFKLFRYLSNESTYEKRLLKEELVNTLDQVTFRSFSRYLQGKGIARLNLEKINVISWYENQAIHKNLYKGLRTNNKIKIYGAQLCLFSKNILNMIVDENEKNFSIVPDKILVNGKAFIPKITNLNYEVGPSFRYAKLFNTISLERKNILVVLPYFHEHAKEMLKIIGDLNLAYFIKLHQSHKFKDFKNLFAKNAVIVSNEIYKLFETARILIGTASGTLLEAVSVGIPVIVVKNNLLLDFNTLPPYGKDLIWREAGNKNEIIMQIDEFNNSFDSKIEMFNKISTKYKSDYFCMPTYENVIKSFDFLKN